MKNYVLVCRSLDLQMSVGRESRPHHNGWMCSRLDGHSFPRRDGDGDGLLPHVLRTWVLEFPTPGAGQEPQPFPCPHPCIRTGPRFAQTIYSRPLAIGEVTSWASRLQANTFLVSNTCSRELRACRPQPPDVDPLHTRDDLIFPEM